MSIIRQRPLANETHIVRSLAVARLSTTGAESPKGRPRYLGERGLCPKKRFEGGVGPTPEFPNFQYTNHAEISSCGDDLENGPTDFAQNLHAALKWDSKNFFLLTFPLNFSKCWSK